MSRVGMLLAPKRLKLIAVYSDSESPVSMQLSVYLFVSAPRVLGRAIMVKFSSAGLRWRSIRFLS